MTSIATQKSPPTAAAFPATPARAQSPPAYPVYYNPVATAAVAATISYIAGANTAYGLNWHGGGCYTAPYAHYANHIQDERMDYANHAREDWQNYGSNQQSQRQQSAQTKQPAGSQSWQGSGQAAAASRSSGGAYGGTSSGSGSLFAQKTASIPPKIFGAPVEASDAFITAAKTASALTEYNPSDKWTQAED